MVSTLRLAHVAVLGAKGVMPGENWRPEGYMTVLRDCGFTDVRMEDKQHHDLTFQAIFAIASKWSCVYLSHTCNQKIANDVPATEH